MILYLVKFTDCSWVLQQSSFNCFHSSYHLSSVLSQCLHYLIVSSVSLCTVARAVTSYHCAAKQACGHFVVTPNLMTKAKKPYQMAVMHPLPRVNEIRYHTFITSLLSVVCVCVCASSCLWLTYYQTSNSQTMIGMVWYSRV